MSLDVQFHLAAGIAALALGLGTLRRAPRQPGGRLFGVLCAALSLWNLGVAARDGLPDAGDGWVRAYLLGSCATAPLALHFAVRFRGALRSRARRRLGIAYAAAGVLWITTWTPWFADRERWNRAALAVLGSILLAALAVLALRLRRLSRGPERRTYGLLLAAGTIATAGGISDFLSLRGPKVGPIAVLLFLLVISGAVIHYRFLDVDIFLARAVSLLVSAVAVGLAIHFTVRWFGAGLLVTLALSIGILMVAGPVSSVLLSSSRLLLGADTSVREALVAASRRIPRAASEADLWRVLEESLRELPGGGTFRAYLRSRRGEPFLERTGSGEESVAADAVLPRALHRDLLTIRLLDLEIRGGPGRGAADARAVRAALEEMGAGIVVALRGDGFLAGWFLLADLPERSITREVAGAVVMLGNQTMESLQRIRSAEEARRREALAAVGEMASGLAHEVRNPLAAIQGAVQVLEGEGNAARQREMLQVVEEESARLGRVAGEFLEYARPASPRREPVALGDLAREAARAAGATGGGAPPEVTVAPGVPEVLGDPDQLRRLFDNLVANAMQAAGPRGRVRIAVVGTGDGRARLSVEDDGPGIPPEDRDRVFRPFHTARPGGTGLGLALVHRIVEGHGGKIRIRTGELGGAAFLVELPGRELGHGDRT